MNPTTGILFAFGALIGWTLGDFSIQRATRAIGGVRTLFYNGTIGAIGFLPFVWQEIPPTFGNPANWPLMLFASVAMFITALIVFQGLKLGKLSVVLPINGIELAVAILLAMVAGQERYTAVAIVYILVVATGLVLTSVTGLDNLKRLKWEKGVAFAVIGAVGLGLNDFAIGFASRQLSPLFIVWLTSLACALGSLVIMLKRNHFPLIRNDFRLHFNVIIAQSFLDNFAWICFAYSATLIPIGFATTISEGYLALGALLGVAINRERLRMHQYAGIALTLVGIFALAYLTS